MTGNSLSHYRIEEKLGEGGMGLVYKAFDTRLRRPVAIKILPPQLVTDEKNLQRFALEAQAASALNHPNICIVHDTDESGGVHFIVMEYIEGETLRQILERRGRLPEPEVIDIGLKVASALQAAHAKGIIHRDIKPENIMISKEGYVKVMDFGLAKLAYEDSEPSSVIESSLGMRSIRTYRTSMSVFLGTSSYMSPEQIEKQTIDHRSDIFSLGIVLYEMAFGHAPFTGETTVDIMKSILHDSPRFEINGKCPVSKTTVQAIRCALRKPPHERFQNMQMFSNALAPQRTAGHVQRVKAGKGRSSVFLLASLLVVAGAAWFFMKSINEAAVDLPAKFANTLKTYTVTDWPGLEDEPSFSPKGDKIAFVSDRAGNMDVWIKDLAGGKEVNLTSDCPERDESPRWSPDGRKILFCSDREGGGVFVVDISTRAVTSITSLGAQPAWAPDGRKIAYITRQPPVGKALYIVAVDGGLPKLVFQTEKDEYIYKPAWSHDGKWLAFAFGSNMSWNIFVKSVDGRNIFQLSDDTSFNYFPVWGHHDETIFFRSDRGGVNDIWMRNVVLDKAKAVGEMAPLTFGAGVKAIDIADDGKRIVYSKTASRANIFAVNLNQPNRSQTTAFRQITNGDHFALDPSISPDGSRIAYTSYVQGRFELWVSDRDGQNATLLHRPEDSSESPVWSPDGKKIVYIDGDGKEMEVWTMNLEDGKKRQLTRDNYPDMKPDWSPDGKWIAYMSKIQEGEIMVMSVSGGQRRRLTFDPAADVTPRFSPDGKTIAFSSDRGGFRNVWIVSFEGGEPRQLTFDKEVGGLGLCWSLDGRFIYYVAMHEGIRNIWKVSRDGKYREQVTDYRSSLHHVHRVSSISTDGNELYFAAQEPTGDIWLMEPR